MSKDATVLDVDRVINVLQRRCDSLGVTLKWSSVATTAYTDGTNITIPAIKHPVTKDAMDKLYGFVVHESGHHSRPDAFKILQAAKPKGALAALYNITEDDGMERDVAGRYPGDAKALGVGNNVIIRECAESWKEKVDSYPADITEQDMAPVAVCGLGQLSRIEWDGYSNGGRSAFMNTMHPKAAKLLDDLVTEGWVGKFKATKDEHDTWDVACDLYKRLFPNADENQVEKLRTKGHSMQSNDGEGDSENGDGAQVVSGDEGEQSEDGAKGDEEGTGLPEDEGKVISWKDAVLSEHNEWKQKEDGAQPGNVGIDWTDYKKGNVQLMPPEMINVMDCRTKQFTPEQGLKWGRYDGTPESFLSDNAQARQFANQIRRYIQAQGRVRVETEKYHGRLDKRSLVKLALPPIDGGEYNKRLFYDMIPGKALNTCIHVLTDWSGSMQGKKMEYAADASGRLVHTFDRVLRVPVQLAAFTNGRTRCDIGLIKAFNDRSVSPMDIATAFSRFYKFSSANNDADSVMWAYRQLKKRKEQRKILIVLSDGCPAGSWGRGSSSSNLKFVTDFIQKEREIELYGVGICSNAVETYYENNKVLHGPEAINNTLFEIIKQGVKR